MKKSAALIFGIALLLAGCAGQTAPLAADSVTIDLTQRRVEELSGKERTALTREGAVTVKFPQGKITYRNNVDGYILNDDEILGYSKDAPTLLAELQQASQLNGQSVAMGTPDRTNPFCRVSWIYGPCFKIPGAYRWPTRVLGYQYSGFTAQEMASMDTWINNWNTDMKVRAQAINTDGGGFYFKPVAQVPGAPVITIKKSSDVRFCGLAVTGYWGQTGASEVGIRCVEPHTLNHELGHVTGLYHEMERCDRDLYVAVSANIPKRCDFSQDTQVGTYDYDSVMNYMAPVVYPTLNPPGDYQGNPSTVTAFNGPARLSAGDLNTLLVLYPRIR